MQDEESLRRSLLSYTGLVEIQVEGPNATLALSNCTLDDLSTLAAPVAIQFDAEVYSDMSDLQVRLQSTGLGWTSCVSIAHVSTRLSVRSRAIHIGLERFTRLSWGDVEELVRSLCTSERVTSCNILRLTFS